MEVPIDPDSPVPLYHQIAEAIRARMEQGDLKEGDSLEPMRLAAAHWGVNLHTVRHAYAALARDGLVEMRAARGTRVTGAAARIRAGTEAEQDRFVADVVNEARERFGLTPATLAARVSMFESSRRPSVAVVECSAWQCQSHADEITRAWDVDARPWPLSIESEPTCDTIIATYFHYNDIRRQWPHVLDTVRFVTIRPARSIGAWLEDAEHFVLVERDMPTAEAVAADLRTMLGRDLAIRIEVTDDAASVVARHAGSRILFSPRVWSDLDQAVRSCDRCAVVRYEFDGTEIDTIARDLGWRRGKIEGRGTT